MCVSDRFAQRQPAQALRLQQRDAVIPAAVNTLKLTEFGVNWSEFGGHPGAKLFPAPSATFSSPCCTKRNWFAA